MFNLDSRKSYWLTCFIILAVSIYLLFGITFVVGEEADFANSLAAYLNNVIPNELHTIIASLR